MKYKKLIFLFLIIIMGIIIYLVLCRPNSLVIGEEKYLEFLWMVDGAFNEERYQGVFSVNQKELSEDKKVFTCHYLDNNTCQGKDFEISFKNLFASNITYDDVYSDKKTISWYKKEDNDYYFKNSTNCSPKRMGLNHQIKIYKQERNKIIYLVSFDEEYDGLSNNKTYEREFILVKENNKWKISKAYYHDLCYMDYYIE